jgi:hypothetical protein
MYVYVSQWVPIRLHQTNGHGNSGNSGTVWRGRLRGRREKCPPPGPGPGASKSWTGDDWESHMTSERYSCGSNHPFIVRNSENVSVVIVCCNSIRRCPFYGFPVVTIGFNTFLRVYNDWDDLGVALLLKKLHIYIYMCFKTHITCYSIEVVCVLNIACYWSLDIRKWECVQMFMDLWMFYGIHMYIYILLYYI